DALDRHVFRKMSKPIDKFFETNLLFDRSLAELWQETVPIRIPCVKLSQFVAHVDVRSIRDEHWVAQVSPRSCKSSCELQRDRETLPNVMEGRDFQLRKVEAFAEHVTADDDACAAGGYQFPSVLASTFRRDTRVQLNGSVFREFLVYGNYTLGPRHVCHSCHH